MRSILLGLCLLASLSLEAQQADRVYTPADIPNVQRQDSTRLVSDPEDYITAIDESEINTALRDIRARYGVEFAVVVVPTIGDRDIESYSTELFRLWGLGSSKSNNGLLLLLAIEQNQGRYEVGYGLEGAITDAASGRIWRQYMVPDFKRGAYADGILAGVQAIGQILEHSEWRSDGTLALRETNEGEFGKVLLWLYLAFGAMIGISVLMLQLGMVKSVSTPTEARCSYAKVKRSIYVNIVLLIFLCPPISIVLLVWQRGALRRLRKLSAQCTKCGERVEQAPEDQVAEHLTPYQLVETRIGSRRYSLYTCSSCRHQEVCGITVSGTRYTRCSKCLSIAVETLRPVRVRTASGDIMVRTIHRCLCCGDETHTERMEASDAALIAGILLGSLSSGGGRGFRGGSFGGGFGGGGFGGGSSGGGGFTGRW